MEEKDMQFVISAWGDNPESNRYGLQSMLLQMTEQCKEVHWQHYIQRLINNVPFPPLMIVFPKTDKELDEHLLFLMRNNTDYDYYDGEIEEMTIYGKKDNGGWFVA